MVWNKDVPEGNSPISQGDDKIRTNQSAIEDGVGEEHNFFTSVSSADQTGRHQFMVATSAGNRNSASPAWRNGGLVLRSDLVVGDYVLEIAKRDGANVDADFTRIPGTEIQNGWSRFQYGRIEETLTITAGVLDPIDLNLGNHFRIVLTEDITTFPAPTNQPSWPTAGVEISGDFWIHVVMGGGGPHSILAWNSIYETEGGVAPVIATGFSEETLIRATYFSNSASNQRIALSWLTDLQVIT